LRAGAKGGSPRDREIEHGEILILDLGVGFRGYYSDNARGIAVGGEPTEAQQRAWRGIVDVFEMIQSTAKAGVSCRDLFDTAQRQLDAYKPWAFNHHLGHGVGLAPHEGPHLNPRWDDTLAVGEFFTVEPGLYGEELHAGIRLEQNYLVKEDGVELLTDWPLELCCGASGRARREIAVGFS
jgi:Xaa-Pro aminopeptidase